ncbi:MAG: hypothetical protein V7638_2368 [Acidobacteriota bacterium]
MHFVLEGPVLVNAVRDGRGGRVAALSAIEFVRSVTTDCTPRSFSRHFTGQTSLLTDENRSATVRQPLFKMQRADLVLETQNRP